MSKIKETWKLPLPEEDGDEYVWHPIVRVGRIVPWGYEQDPDDPDILLPIPEQLLLMEQAKKYLKRYSYRAVADWLTTQSNRPISHVGLYNRIKLEYKRKTKAGQQRYLAQRYKEALEKAEKLEKGRAGARTVVSSSSSDSETGKD